VNPGLSFLFQGVDNFEADRRFKTAVLLAPFSLNSRGLAAFESIADPSVPSGRIIPDLKKEKVQTLLIGATLDTTLPIMTNTQPVTDSIQCNTANTFRADIEGAEHNGLLEECAFSKTYGEYLLASVKQAPIPGAGGVTLSTLPLFCLLLGKILFRN